MNKPLACEYCNAERTALGEACPRCSQFPLATQERHWRRKLLLLRRSTLLAFAGTLLAALATAIIDWKDALAVVWLSGLQVWIYFYYSRRITVGDATLPGPVSVTRDSKLEERKDWDTWALGLVAVPAIGALVLLARNIFRLLQ